MKKACKTCQDYILCHGTVNTNDDEPCMWYAEKDVEEE